MVPAVLRSVHGCFRHSQLPAGKPPSADADPYTARTQPVKGDGNDQGSAMLGAHTSLQVTT